MALSNFFQSLVLASIVINVSSLPTAWDDWSGATYTVTITACTAPTSSSSSRSLISPSISSSSLTRPSSSTTSIPGGTPAPAYTNGDWTIAAMLSPPDLRGFNFNSTNPNPWDVNGPNPDGPLLDRLEAEEESLPQILSFQNNTGSTASLIQNIQTVLDNAGIGVSNSTLARVLLEAVGQIPADTERDRQTVSPDNISMFLYRCFQFDSCLFWNADTSQLLTIAEITQSIQTSGLWALRTPNSSVWPTITQWVIAYGVDLLVGDRSSTNNMVVPVRLTEGGAATAKQPVTLSLS
ncbi:hypothetical protein H2204_009275 [Knufia peltigerae]|uniref:Uncharacterized protein n=1 Tax=Knufia peltigerae TaxID=1002370 RepID=A0AA38XYE0_9EURO|nr:hypothetical protein H2204_009275 [Knufia peltigerae]